MLGRGSWFAIAFAVTIGPPVAARAAPPTAHAVRIDRAADGRLHGFVSAIRAELLAAGFKVTPETAGAAAPAPAVITVTVDGARARVVAAADGAPSFSAEVALADAGAAPRDVNRVALQVAEWLAAIWLPPPAPARAPAPPGLAAAPAAASSSSELAAVEPPASLAVVPVVPPPFVTTTAARVLPPRAVRAAPPPPPATRIPLLEFGVGVLRAPDFGSQFGFEIGAALHGTSPIVAGATPFARLVLGLYWLGSGIDSFPAFQSFDVNFASLTAAAGLRWPVADTISVETSAGVGLTLVWFGYADPTVAIGAAYRNDSTWVATPGGALALVYRFSQRWALAGEARASWMVPGLVFVKPVEVAQVGGSYAPMLTSTLALRVVL